MISGIKGLNYILADNYTGTGRKVCYMNNNIGIFICIVGLIALPFVVYYFGCVSGVIFTIGVVATSMVFS